MKTFARIFLLTLLGSALLSQDAHAAPKKKTGPHAVTVWWVIFNEPDQCFGNPDESANCTALDVFGPAYLESRANGTPDPTLITPNLAARPAMIYATGGKTDNRGRVRLTASIFVSPAGEYLDLPPGVDPLGLGTAFESENAEIHLIVRDHGRAHPTDLVTQITNLVDPYCSDPNILYYAGPNVCHDEQFAVFGTGESGEDSVYAFADMSRALPRARAVMLRGRDSVRVVIETRINRRDAELP